MNPNADPRIQANQLYLEYLTLYWSETALQSQVDAAKERWDAEIRRIDRKDAQEILSQSQKESV